MLGTEIKVVDRPNRGRNSNVGKNYEGIYVKLLLGCLSRDSWNDHRHNYGRVRQSFCLPRARAPKPARLGVTLPDRDFLSVTSHDTSRLAFAHVIIWVGGTIILTCGVAAIYLGRPDLEPIAIAGSLIVLGAMLMFAFLVFRSERTVMQ